MVDGEWYIAKIKDYFSFLIVEYGYKVSAEKIRGNFFYDLSYCDNTKNISISYENIEDYFTVIIFILHEGEIPSYDDKTNTLHLNKLNEIVLPSIKKDEMSSNNEYFKEFNPSNEFDRKLLKSAKELRLCLRHLNEINF